MRRAIATGFGVALIFYILIAGVMMYREPVMVYHPAERTVAIPAAHFALGQRSIAFRSADGTRLSGWVIPALPPDSSGIWILVCHGNYGNIGYGRRPDFYSDLRALGVNLLVFDYRGFGASEGSPSESGLYADARAAYDLLRDSLGVPASRIMLFGHSLGTGVAVELALHVAAAALILEGAYTSVPDVGQGSYPYLPVRLLMSNRFASIEKVGRIAIPKLFLHSPEDDVIPYDFGLRLYQAAAGPKHFVAVRGGHMDAFVEDSARYFGAVRDLVAAAIRSAPAPR